MTETERIVRMYDQVLRGNAWHGDPTWQILDGISPEGAAHRGLPGAHNIWDIVLHMTFWEGVATRRVAGERAGLDEALNFPAPPAPTEVNWKPATASTHRTNCFAKRWRQLIRRGWMSCPRPEKGPCMRKRTE